ncbi:hypothetical protein HN011_000541 [Eciton burchellii]|nr:hypothetical protein HN011_000541 [Eciton burchellii]
MPQESFITEFLKRCKEYDVTPLPRFLVNGVEQFAKAETEPEKKLEEMAPTFRVSFENSKKMERVQKLECKDKPVSSSILDVLDTTLQKYNTITVLKLSNCRINAEGVQQIAQILTRVDSLRDLNLDNNPNAEENYHLLCKPIANLHYLSLKMCKLSDNGIEKIANELMYQDPPDDPKLIALNVADNGITDIGAAYIATMLRTNRSLQSLVLSGNKIQDDGAVLIIQELCMSALTHEETVDLRRRKFIELGRKQLPENSLRSDTVHPFMKETMPMKGSMLTTGNMELQHLSLSFNRLTNETLKKLISCLYYQNYLLLNDLSRGLLHVSLESSGIQKDEDWITFQELLRRKQDNADDFEDGFEMLMPVKSVTLREGINVRP